ncbi:hypothetical protein IFR05_017429 [Cadophora sp. M221]|nr:hypothetical protein IFR05_017429 [Cadophora sp. M221]
MMPEITIKPFIRVPEALFWRDLDEADRCLRSNEHNLLFWATIRFIAVEMVDFRIGHPNSREPGYPVTKSYSRAHRVFARLLQIHRRLCTLNGNNLAWLRINLPIWQMIGSLSDPGMLPLSLLRGIPAVRFITNERHPISYFIDPRLSRHITRVTRKSAANERSGSIWRSAGWKTTGRERELRNGSWKAAAERRQRRGRGVMRAGLETIEEARLRYLGERATKQYGM